MKPYYQDDYATIYHGDAREAMRYARWDAVVSDPPYPNNAGHFDDGVAAAAEVVGGLRAPEAIIFWSEIEPPYCPLPLVALHVWHRSNVNGRPWEAAYHFCKSGQKRRSEVLRHPAIFNGAGPGCHEYLGHPTQKPVALMQQLIGKTGGVVLDPFMGSGSTLKAAKNLGRKAIGIEIEERYCEIAAKRLSQEVLPLEAS